jgi:hypothetical protein
LAVTHQVDVSGIGAFLFKSRTLRDQFRIEAEALRILGGPVDDEALRSGAIAFAALIVLTVEAPEGWDLDSFDPLDPDDTAKVFTVHRSLRDAELRFRAGPVGRRA